MEATRVATLVGRRQLAMAQACLSSLRRTAVTPIQNVVHSDGSLGECEYDALAGTLEGVAFVRSPEADERVHEALTRHPACRAYRDGDVLARKLLDIALVEEGADIVYCDADVLFLRPFEGLFQRPDGVDAVFQADAQEAYSVRSWDFLRHPDLRLRSRVNTGIVVYRRAAFDLDLLEWFLSRSTWRRTPEWLEQTAWALLAGRQSCHLLDPTQIALAGVPSSDPVAIHFVSSRREGLEPALRAWRDRSSEVPERVRSHPAPRCGPLRLLRSELRRRLAR
jgi:hypothetical protein